MDRLAAGVVDGEESALANGEAFSDQFGGFFFAVFFEPADNRLDVVFAVAVEPQRLGGREELAVGANLFVAVPRGPFADVGVEAFAVPNARGEQQQVAPFFGLRFQAAD